MSCGVGIFKDVGDDGNVFFSVALKLYDNVGDLMELEIVDSAVYGFGDGAV